MGVNFSDDEFVSALSRHVRKHPFWRGGQAHGRLKTSELRGAYTVLLRDNVGELAAGIKTWSAARSWGARLEAVRCTLDVLERISVALKAKAYFCKRAVEIIVLVGTRV